MKSRLSQILLLLGAFFAFIPVIAVDFLMDSYVRSQAESRFQESVNGLVAKNQTAVYEAIASIQQVMRDSPSLCTATFVSNIQKQLLANNNLLQITVENSDGVQYCDGFDAVTRYSILSSTLPIPGTSELISVVQINGSAQPGLMISRTISTKRKISAFIQVNADLTDIFKQYEVSNGYLHVDLTNDATIISVGEEIGVDQNNIEHSDITITSTADSLPLRAEIVIPFSSVRGGFSGLYTIMTIMASLVGVGILTVIIFLIRQSDLPTIDIERALAKGEFKPFYQPVVNLRNGSLVGCEVLVRWVKKDGTIISPGMFIDLAESSGLAVPMTINLMEQVRDDLEELCADQRGLKIGINLFEGHFRNTSIVDDVKDIFGGSEILFSQLVFEITERNPLTNQQAVEGVIGGLQAQGCKMAMDDAGTGHSNLAYMQTLGVDIIKIDRVFVNMIGPDTESVPILDGLISMAFDLEADIIAEGVETEYQAVYLRSRGVVQAQGFFFAPALRKESYIELAKTMNGSQQSSAASSNINSEAA